MLSHLERTVCDHCGRKVTRPDFHKRRKRQRERVAAAQQQQRQPRHLNY